MFDRDSTYLMLVKSCKLMQGYPLPEYDFAIEAYGDINHNFQSQQYVTEMLQEKKIDIRIQQYFPNDPGLTEAINPYETEFVNLYTYRDILPYEEIIT